MKQFATMIVCVAVVTACGNALAKDATASEQFDKAYKTMLAADDARDGEHNGQAVALYKQALEAYMELAKKYPSWTPGKTKFRITYCNNQIDALMKGGDNKPGGAGARGPATADAAAPAAQPPPQASAVQVTREQNAMSVDQIKKTASRLLAAGKADDARALLIDGLHMEPDNRSMRLMVGIAQCQAGMFTDAVYVLAELAKDDPSNSTTQLALAAAYVGLGKFDDATRVLQDAIGANPNLPEAHYDLAQILRVTSPADTGAIRTEYEKSLSLGGGSDKDLDALTGRSAAAPATATKTKKR
jgi:tetratricopeptide (TPR) repeat protein